MKLSHYDFDLPDELIADRPCSPRQESKMLVCNNPYIDTSFSNFLDYVGVKDLVVINNTRVIPILLKGQSNGINFLITLHKNIGETKWLAFVKPGKKISIGQNILFNKNITCTVTEKLTYGEIELEFDCSKSKFDKFIEDEGNMPLPPYIQKKRQSDSKDFNDYQTVYATEKGSIAAPTAGLHFNDAIINHLKKNNQLIEVTLHVGAGTFLPIRNDDLSLHKMHSEHGTISQKSADRIRECKLNGGKIISVGTTTLRLLESAVINSEINKFMGETDIFIKPGYKFKVVDILLTNFHLPKSTLLLLISAFSGTKEIKNMYNHAIKNNYRFFSYGDVSLLYKND